MLSARIKIQFYKYSHRRQKKNTTLNGCYWGVRKMPRTIFFIAFLLQSHHPHIIYIHFVHVDISILSLALFYNP